MSNHGKKKGRKHRRRRASVLTMECFACMQKQSVTAEVAIEHLAEALNLLEAAGMPPIIRSEFIIAEGERGGGFILPPLHGSGWQTHMVTYNPTARMSRREDDTDS